MFNRKFTLHALLFFAVFMLLTAVAQAAPSRTYVSASGTDAGDCSSSACRTIAYAISQTESRGEVIVRDSGEYDTFTIDKGISVIAPDGVEAIIRIPGANSTAITVNAGASDLVQLQGLKIKSIPNYNNVGVLFQGGKSLLVKRLDVSSCHTAVKHISNGEMVVVELTAYNNNVAVGLLNQANYKTAVVHIEKLLAEGNSYGVWAGSALSDVRLTIRDSVIRKTDNEALVAQHMNTKVAVDNCIFSNSGTGASAVDSAVVRISNSTITNNNTGVNGTVVSRGNNTLEDNTSGNSFSANYSAK